MYDRSIPVFLHGLTALAGVLSKAEAHCAAQKIDPAVFLGFRLYPDMLSFTRQVQLTCDFAARGAARLADTEPKSFPDTETDFSGLQARIAAAKDYIGSFSAEALQGAEAREITLKVAGEERKFSGAAYLSYFVLPNFYFHMTTAYDILRHNGVVLSKSDFMGA
jgi:uncharacterized protein